MITIADTAQAIAQHASTGPAPAGQPGRVANTLSPHFERVTTEIIRKLLIRGTQAQQKAIQHELSVMADNLPLEHQSRVLVTIAKINAILQSVYK